MHGRVELSSIDEIVAYWQRFALDPGFIDPVDGLRKPGAALTWNEAGEALVAYVNHSRWVANCPGCGGGIACWPEHGHGACLDCGNVWPIIFPSPRDIAAGSNVLLARPEASTRNWRVDRGEDRRRPESGERAARASRGNSGGWRRSELNRGGGRRSDIWPGASRARGSPPRSSPQR